MCQTQRHKYCKKVAPVIDVIPEERLMERHTGEPRAAIVQAMIGKGYWKGAPMQLAFCLLYNRTTAKRVVAQDDCQETASTHGCLLVPSIMVT